MRNIITTVIAVLSLASCGTVSNKLVGFGGNPPPNMKSIHMATTHDGYTREDYDRHPDRDCNGTFSITVDTKPKYEVDSALEPYLNEFVAIAKENGIDLSYIYDEDISIQFIDKVDGRVASAPSWQRRDGLLIMVRRSTFENRTEEGKKYVMFHEFGHDILNYLHVEKKSRPRIMEANSYSGYFRRYDEESRKGQADYVYFSLQEMFNHYKENKQ